MGHAPAAGPSSWSLGNQAVLTGIRVTNGRNKEDRVLFFDNLAVYTESLPPLTFEPRPLRGITLFPGQTTGTNTGPGKLPSDAKKRSFPTICPSRLPLSWKRPPADSASIIAAPTATWSTPIGRRPARSAT